MNAKVESLEIISLIGDRTDDGVKACGQYLVDVSPSRGSGLVKLLQDKLLHTHT